MRSKLDGDKGWIATPRQAGTRDDGIWILVACRAFHEQAEEERLSQKQNKGKFFVWLVAFSMKK